MWAIVGRLKSQYCSFFIEEKLLPFHKKLERLLVTKEVCQFADI